MGLPEDRERAAIAEVRSADSTGAKKSGVRRPSAAVGGLILFLVVLAIPCTIPRVALSFAALGETMATSSPKCSMEGLACQCEWQRADRCAAAFQASAWSPFVQERNLVDCADERVIEQVVF